MGEYAVVGVIGALVGFGELASRNKLRPSLIFATVATYIYVLLNVAAACAALYLMRIFNWNLGMAASDPALPTAQALIAGFGAMAFLRSSFFVLRIGDKDVGIGPGVFLTGVIEVTDLAVQRSVDRMVVRARARLASLAVEGLDYDAVALALPTYCMALAGNSTAVDAEAIANQIVALRDAPMPDAQKVVMVGALCINTFGEEVVVAAIEQLRRTLPLPSAAPSKPSASGSASPR